MCYCYFPRGHAPKPQVFWIYFGANPDLKNRHLVIQDAVSASGWIEVCETKQDKWYAHARCEKIEMVYKAFEFLACAKSKRIAPLLES